MFISLKTLVDLDACDSQVDVFRKLYGTKAEVTEENALKGLDRFSWSWAVNKLLAPEQRKYYFKELQRIWDHEAATFLNPDVAPSVREASSNNYRKAVATVFVKAYLNEEMKTSRPYSLEDLEGTK